MDWSELIAVLSSDKTGTVPDIKLPILPAAFIEFTRKAKQPDITPRELSGVLETDTGLTCALLRYANSGAIGLRKSVTSTQRAIGLLGIRATETYLATTAIKLAMKERESKLINLKNFWFENLERALFARHVARLIGADTELAYAAAMLQDYLLPIITNEFYEDYVQFAEQTQDQPCDVVEFEQNRFGWNHAEVGARIMFDWGIPEDLVCCVLVHHRGRRVLSDPELRNTAAAAVAVSSLVPDALGQVPNGLDQLLDLDETWPQFNLPEIAEQIDEEIQELSQNATNQFSLLKRYQKVTRQHELVGS